MGEQHESCPPHGEIGVSQISHESFNERGCFTVAVAAAAVVVVAVVELAGEELVNGMGALNNGMSKSEEHGAPDSWIRISELAVHPRDDLRVHKRNSPETLSHHRSHSFFVAVAIIIHQDRDNGVQVWLEAVDPVFGCPKKANSFLESVEKEIPPPWDLLDFVQDHRKVGVQIPSNDSTQRKRSSRLDLLRSILDLKRPHNHRKQLRGNFSQVNSSSDLSQAQQCHQQPNHRRRSLHSIHKMSDNMALFLVGTLRGGDCHTLGH